MDSLPALSMAPKRRALEIFLSLGASAGVIAVGLGDLPPGLAQSSPHGGMHHQEGGEGGEGGEGSSSSEPRSNAEQLLVLAQMQLQAAEAQCGTSGG